jgi:LPXTG-motif cell wall-anchored protein
VGLYLVKQDAQGTGDNKMFITPYLITIPQKSRDGSLIYDVDAAAKPIGVAKEEVPPPTPPKPPVLPQTGQLWWPVMVLGGVGVLALCVGMVRKNRNK